LQSKEFRGRGVKNSTKGGKYVGGKLQKEITRTEELLTSLEQRGSEAQSRASAAESKRRELASDALLEGRPVPEKDVSVWTLKRRERAARLVIASPQPDV